MKVFVSGASGFIGSAVVRELVSRGHEVTGLVRSASKATAVEKLGASTVIGNLYDPTAWTDAVKASDAVISATRPIRLGEKISVVESHRRSYNHGKMVGNILGAAANSNVRNVVLTYGVQGFGNCGTDWVDESALLSPVGYERTVSGAFWHIDKTSRRARIPITNMFVGWPYGPEGWLGSMARGMARGSVRMVGTGDNYLSMIHMDDLTAAYAEVVERGLFGARFCIVDGKPVTQRELLEIVADSTGSKMPRECGVDTHASRSCELAAEMWSCSTRVSGENMQKRLLPKLKHESVYEGFQSVMDELGLAARGDEEYREAS